MPKVAAIQMGSTHDIASNVATAVQLIEEAAQAGSQLVVLPENFATFGLAPSAVRASAEIFMQGDVQRTLAAVAKKHKLWLVAGTLPLQTADKNKLSASCLVWDPSGELAARYDKIHLFDVTTRDGDEYHESATFQKGDRIVTLTTPLGKLGLAVCYDIRFPELFRAFMLQGVDIIILPAAFTQSTGAAHWDILVRARAIENLCYLIASAEIGTRADGRGTYGHSMIVDPWGEILAEAAQAPGFVSADIDIAKMTQMRLQFPVLTHYEALVMQELCNNRGNP